MEAPLPTHQADDVPVIPCPEMTTCITAGQKHAGLRPHL